MLLEFELKNDAAFASAATLSLVATSLRDEDGGRVVEIGDHGGTKALTSALILGKNGSGKSTLIRAMRFVGDFVRHSARESQTDDGIPYEPNRIVDGLENAPTYYRVAFSMHGAIYEFEFSHDAVRVVHEKLQIADRSVRFRKMYERTWDRSGEKYQYDFGEALTGKRSTWADSTRENALFLSTANQLNADDLKVPFQWLSKYLRSTNVTSDSSGGFTAKKCLEDDETRSKVVNFLKAMDINVEEIHIEEEELDRSFITSTFASEFLETIRKAGGDLDDLSTRLKVYFEKSTKSGGRTRFSLSKESTGTRGLFNLAGPLFDCLENGYCLLVDEINTSLHPVIVSFLVDMFANHDINKKRAQLIFTSHDTTVLSQKKMRRDQVWVIDNNLSGATLTPLSDYSVRKNEALEKGYLGGRYGGIPVVTAALLGTSVAK